MDLKQTQELEKAEEKLKKHRDDWALNHSPMNKEFLDPAYWELPP